MEFDKEEPAPGGIERACWVYYAQGPIYPKPLEVKWHSGWGEYISYETDSAADGLGFHKHSLTFSFVSTDPKEVQLVIDTAKVYHDIIVDSFTNWDEENNGG